VKSQNNAINLPIYTVYNLDIHWYNNSENPKVLLLDTDLLKAFPMSEKTIDFIMKLSSEFSNILCFVGNWNEFQNYLNQVNPEIQCVFREHPTNRHYQGICEERDWIAPEITKYYPSFFGYWKTYEKNYRK
jgi:deoxyribodipyrimidine photo-lyase